MAVLIVLPAYLAMRTKPSEGMEHIAVLDASETDVGTRVAKLVGAGRESQPKVRSISPLQLTEAESTATREVREKKLEGYLVVDALTASGEAARYAGRNASTIPDMELLKRSLRDAIVNRRLEGAGLDPARVTQLSKVDMRFHAERLTENGRSDTGDGELALAYTVAMLLYVSIVLFGQAIMMGVIEEKTQRVAEVVVASVSPDRLLAGKVLGVGAVGLTQQCVWVISGLLLLRFNGPLMHLFGLQSFPTALPSVTPANAIALLVFFVLGFTFFSTMFAAAGSMVNSTQDAQSVATPLTLLIVPSVILVGPVLLSPNSSLSTTMSMIPFTAPILMPVRMSITAVPWWQVGVAIVGLCLACYAAVWVAARIYRVGILMYGKKPSLAELGHWIRQSR
jgi:ABC-2 type transport system permease protein